MKLRNGLFITVIAVVGICLASNSAWAGSKQRHRWEGVAIGVGAAIIGGALINHHSYGYPSGPSAAYSYGYRNTHRHSPRHHGAWKRYHGGRHTYCRPVTRVPHYRGHSRFGSNQGYGTRRGWKSHGRGAFDGPRRHGRGHDGRRR